MWGHLELPVQGDENIHASVRDAVHQPMSRLRAGWVHMDSVLAPYLAHAARHTLLCRLQLTRHPRLYRQADSWRRRPGRKAVEMEVVGDSMASP
jgi:hypothetical protein